MDKINFKGQVSPTDKQKEGEKERIARYNTLEKSPANDAFESSIKPKKNGKIGTICASIVALGATGYGIIKGKENFKLKSSLSESLQENNRLKEAMTNIAQSSISASEENQRLRTKIGEQQKKLNELISQVQELLDKAPSDSKYIKEYEKLIQDIKLNWDYSKPISLISLNPAQKAEHCFDLNSLLARITDTSPDLAKYRQIHPGKFDPKAAKLKLKEEGYIDIQLPKSDFVRPTKDPKAKLPADAKNIGETVNTEMALDYGAQLEWSDSKIARDIMQNFYDGHSQTLDGVRIQAQKTNNGTYKIRIEGEGTYNHEHIVVIGSSGKKGSLQNAGGYGEGTKVLSGKLLSQGKVNNVRFASADWIIDLSAGEERIMRTVNRTAEPIDGNFVEFETSNEAFVDSLIESINYFNHGANPDFQKLEFENDELGFRILNPGEKGNLYLTQRFEYGDDGSWSDCLEDMTLIFKNKVNQSEYQAATGKTFITGRDRQKINTDEIAGLTYYFATRAMGAEEIAQAIASTSKHWEAIASNKGEHKGIAEFIKGLVKAAKEKGVGIDLSQDSPRYVAATNNSDTVVETLKSYGYKIVPSELADVGIPRSEDVFKALSIHKSLEPTEAEIKKLKLLEEAMQETYKKIQASLAEKIRKANITPKNKNAACVILDEFFTAEEKKEMLTRLNAQITEDDVLSLWYMMANNSKIKHSDIFTSIRKESNIFNRIARGMKNMTPAELCKSVLQGKKGEFSERLEECISFTLRLNKNQNIEKIEKYLRDANIDISDIIALKDSNYDEYCNMIIKKVTEKVSLHEIKENELIDLASGLVYGLKENLGSLYSGDIKKVEELAKRCNVSIHEAMSSEDFDFAGNEQKILALAFETGEEGKQAAEEYLNSKIKSLMKNLPEDETKALCEEITTILNKKLKEAQGDRKSLEGFIEKLWKNSRQLELSSLETVRTLRDYMLISPEDIVQPRYIFDRHSEIATNTLGESIADIANRKYYGHWIDREYLETAQFDDLYGTWLHEICHKGGGDGTADFTYILTDMIKVIASSSESCQESSMKLKAIEKVYNDLCASALKEKSQ